MKPEGLLPYSQPNLVPYTQITLIQVTYHPPYAMVLLEANAGFPTKMPHALPYPVWMIHITLFILLHWTALTVSGEHHKLRNF
jgi:hypothetical protein